MRNFILSFGGLTLSMSVVIFILLVLSRIFKNRFTATCRYVIWLVVIVRLVLPIGSIAFPSFINIAVPVTEDEYSEVIQSDELTNTVPDIQHGIDKPTFDNFDDTIEEQGRPSIEGVADNDDSVIGPSDDSVKTENELPSVQNPSADIVVNDENKLSANDYIKIIFAVWVVGAAVFFGANIVRYISFSAKLNYTLTLPDDRLTEVYIEACRRLNLDRNPLLHVSGGVGSPVHYGFITKKIVVPADVSEESLVNVLSHELTHYKRGDLWVKLIALAANSINWFNPFVYFAVRELNDEMELSCDELVLRGLNEEERITYSRALLETAGRCNNVHIGLTTHFDSKESKVKKRIMNILDTTKKKKGTVIVAAVLIVCVVAGVLIGFSADKKEESPKENKPMQPTYSETVKESESEEPLETEPLETEPLETEPPETEPPETEPNTTTIPLASNYDRVYDSSKPSSYYLNSYSSNSWNYFVFIQELDNGLKLYGKYGGKSIALQDSEGKYYEFPITWITLNGLNYDKIQTIDIDKDGDNEYYLKLKPEKNQFDNNVNHLYLFDETDDGWICHPFSGKPLFEKIEKVFTYDYDSTEKKLTVYNNGEKAEEIRFGTKLEKGEYFGGLEVFSGGDAIITEDGKFSYNASCYVMNALTGYRTHVKFDVSAVLEYSSENGLVVKRLSKVEGSVEGYDMKLYNSPLYSNNSNWILRTDENWWLHVDGKNGKSFYYVNLRYLHYNTWVGEMYEPRENEEVILWSINLEKAPEMYVFEDESRALIKYYCANKNEGHKYVDRAAIIDLKTGKIILNGGMTEQMMLDAHEISEDIRKAYYFKSQAGPAQYSTDFEISQPKKDVIRFTNKLESFDKKIVLSGYVDYNITTNKATKYIITQNTVN